VENKELKEIFGEDRQVQPTKRKVGVKIIALITAASIVLLAFAFSAGLVIGRNTGINKDMPLMVEAYKLIKKYYYKDISWKEFEEIGAAAFAGSLDMFSGMVSVDGGNSSSGSFGLYMESGVYNEHIISFISPQNPTSSATASYRYDESMQLDGAFDGKITRVKIEEGDKIFAVGLSNDELTKVDGANVQLLRQLLGSYPQESEVIFVIKKYAGNGRYYDGYYGINLFRSELDPFEREKQAYYYSYTDEVGIIKLLEFSNEGDVDFVACLNQFNADGKKKLILDLRNNGGGNLTSLQYIAHYLCKNPGNAKLPLMKLVSNAGNGNMHSEIIYSDSQYYSGDILPDAYPLSNRISGFEVIVLANSSSASASEALIGALQYYNGMQIVGTKTFGKGVAQRVFQLSNGALLYVTNGTYYIPTSNENGELVWDVCIHENGFTPVLDADPQKNNYIAERVTPYADDACTLRAMRLLGY